jgi:predicted ArsR family transcriptional regulator
VKALSEKTAIPPEKIKEMQERTRERNLILREMKNRGASTIDDLSEATGLEKSKLLKHIIAMRQFGKVVIVGERDNQLIYSLPEGGES